MKILFVSKYYHPHVGGVESQTRLVAQALAAHHRVDIAAMRLGSVRSSYTDGNTQVHLLKPAPLDFMRAVPKATLLIRQSGFDYDRIRAIPYALALRPFARGKDIVHCTTLGFLGWAAEMAAAAEGVPFLMTPYVHPGHGGDRTSRVSLYKHAVIVFALLETDRQHLISLGVRPDRIRLSGVVPLLPATVDPAKLRARLQLDDAPMVLFLGRMAPHKGYAEVLNAAPIVWREMPNVHFVFAGPGDATAEKTFADHRDERVSYLGELDEQTKGDTLAACDLFCMPSTAEILPAVYLEAWSYGKAVVAGTAHGLADLVEGNGAGVVADRQPEAIARKILLLLRDAPGRRQMGERGRALVRERFSEAALVNVHERAYEDACLTQTQAAS
jgi:glycosyltransferase involved in cell wall biosynthesis